MITAQNMPNMISNQLTNQNMVNYQNISMDRIGELGYCERSSVAWSVRTGPISMIRSGWVKHPQKSGLNPQQWWAWTHHHIMTLVCANMVFLGAQCSSSYNLIYTYICIYNHSCRCPISNWWGFLPWFNSPMEVFPGPLRPFDVVPRLLLLGFMVHVPHRMAHLAHGNGGDHESTWPRHVFQATEGSRTASKRQSGCSNYAWKSWCILNQYLKYWWSWSCSENTWNQDWIMMKTNGDWNSVYPKYP